jgi:predicted CXXCH cytochrome family protein
MDAGASAPGPTPGSTMPRRRWFTAWLAPALATWAALAPLAAGVGEWHRDRALVCSNCHTMHNSSRGVAMRYDDSDAPANVLLRAESATAVCLACHRSDRAGVEVSPPVDLDPPGGGFPLDLSDPDYQAHSLGSDALVPPEGDTPVVMSCVTCHDPHGNGAYRNLRPSPSGTGRSTASPRVTQVVTANGRNTDSVFARANVRYLSGMSQWCMDCHNLLADQHSAHPWDRPIAGSPMTDYGTWSGTVENRVPVENPTGAASPNLNDQVFCLSCHKAHGSPHYAAMIYADGMDVSTTCQQCHNQ